MPRSRKSANTKTIPLATPDSKQFQQPEKPLIDISEEEQWRIINQTGILKSAALQESPSNRDVSSMSAPDEITSLGDEIFNAMLLIIPFSSILLMMEILIRHQYGKEATFDVIMNRMIPGIPILSLFIFYTIRYKRDRRMQALLFIISILVGSRMLWQMDNGNWLSNMQQVPPLATVWIYTIVQLDLGTAVASLAVIGAYVWWQDITIFR